MNFKKIILIIISLLFFTGCSVEYNLIVDEKTMVEEIRFSYTKNDENKNKIEDLLNNSVAAYYNPDSNSTGYYSMKQSSSFNELYITYSYEYSGNQLRNSNAVNRCYYKRNVINTEDTIIIEATGAFRCLYDDYSRLINDAVVKIKTDLKVEENNADEVKGNQYIWKIDDTNYKDKPIYIKIDKTKKSIFAWLSEFMPSILIIIGVSMVVGVVILIINFKSKKANRI